MNSMKNLIIIASWFFLISGTSIIVLFLYKSSLDGYEISRYLATNYKVTGQFGDFVGGVVGTFFALAGTLLIFLTFKQQADENKRNAFDASFFEMIKIYRDNINEMQYFVKNDSNNEMKYHNRQVIRVIVEDFIDCYAEVTKFLRTEDINDYFHSDYFNKLKEIKKSAKERFDFREIARIDIAYLIVFYGLGREGEPVIKNILKKITKKKVPPESKNAMIQLIPSTFRTDF